MRRGIRRGSRRRGPIRDAIEDPDRDRRESERAAPEGARDEHSPDEVQHVDQCRDADGCKEAPAEWRVGPGDQADEESGGADAQAGGDDTDGV